LATRRLVLIPGIVVLILALVWDLLVALVLHIPPGYATTTAADQTVTSQVFSMIGGDVGIAVVVFGTYFTLTFSRKSGQTEATWQPDTARSRVPLQVAWISLSAVLVLFAAGFGVVELEGQTAPGLVVPSAALTAGAEHNPLIVQVIAQQWQFTYRYPQYGGFETQQLRLPVDRLIQFDVTSLDVTHQFWAYQLAIKLDANQGTNNVGYVYITKPTVIDVRCGELCGLWHGYMTNVGSQAGEALSPAAFNSWLSYAQATYGPEEKYLPKFALVYYPQPLQYGS
jgi:cytochrome c oxidase subunit II